MRGVRYVEECEHELRRHARCPSSPSTRSYGQGERLPAWQSNQRNEHLYGTRAGVEKREREEKGGGRVRKKLMGKIRKGGGECSKIVFVLRVFLKKMFSANNIVEI